MPKPRNRGNGEGSIFKRQEGGPWYLSWFDHDGKRCEACTKTTDKATAQRILADKLAAVALRREGIIDARVESMAGEAKKSIELHLVAFKAMMEGRQRQERYIAQTLNLIREVCASADFQTPNDISADGVNLVIAEIRSRGKSARSIQARVVAMKAFAKWLADHAKLSHDPLRTLKRPNVKHDRRLRRRMLLPDEWPYLCTATLASGSRDGMLAFERVTLYATAIQTGLRQNELRSLTKADLYLAGERPFVRCRADNTKNGMEAKQYIQVDLAADLQA